MTSASWLFLLFCGINLLNYVDRGIIPGAPTQFQYFIERTLHVDVSQEGVYLGLLASSFIASYALFIMLFGYLSIFVKPFRLIGIGLLVWCVAMLLCGLAKPAQSFGLLLAGRILSGIGESSFQCIAPPFIDDYAPASTRTLWMGVFFTLTSAGTALGYAYGAVLANSSWGWDWAFYIVAIAMFPLAYICLAAIPSQYDQPSQCSVDGHLKDTQHLLHKETESKLSFWQESYEVMVHPIFLLSVFGSAAFTFSISGLGVFGPLFLIGLGVFEHETEASMVFGALVVISAVVGTPLGGYLLDLSAHQVHSTVRQYYALRQMFILMAIGTALALVAWYGLPSKVWFLSFVGLALIFLFATPSCTAIAVLLCVDPSRRPLAVAVNTLMIHALGDVPSPIILGWLKDYYAPNCGSVQVDDKIVLNPLCRNDAEGLKLTFLFPLLWMLWTVITWGAAVVLVRFRVVREGHSF
ncbi:Major Facilitator Superfamily (MFS) [Thraustotheca clavata]|uniref:Major Facilitator Superfamily (MFS) n=1 Tax=Thraustotheca clavata TaxID=74557 RepID=A0A1V9ZLQ6_9STRA|nr:Major Facilitator Superfamily (MFS) [Thraustotheca clavata]